MVQPQIFQLFALERVLAPFGYNLWVSCDICAKLTLKLRLDKLLVERGFVASRERAQALILAGKVLADDQKLEKAGAQVGCEATIRLLGEDLKYVSRGGLKLERALEHWQVEVEGKECLDVGA